MRRREMYNTVVRVSPS